MRQGLLLLLLIHLFQWAHSSVDREKTNNTCQKRHKEKCLHTIRVQIHEQFMVAARGAHWRMLKEQLSLGRKEGVLQTNKKKVQTMVVILYWMSAKWYALCYIFYTDHFSCNCYNSPIRHVLEYPFYMKKLRIKDCQSLVQTSTYLKLESIYNLSDSKTCAGKTA